MRKHIIAILWVLFSTWQAVTAQDTQAVVVTPTAKFYTKPSIKSKLILTAKTGARFYVLSPDHKNGWYHVSLLGGNVKGWIYGNNIVLAAKIVQPETGGNFDHDTSMAKLLGQPKKEYQKNDWLNEKKTEWQLIGSYDLPENTGPRMSWLYNSHSVLKSTTGILEFWVKETPAVTVSENSTVKWFQTLALWRVDCAKQRSQIAQYTMYNEAGDSINSRDTPDGGFIRVTPGTIGEDILQRVCRYKEFW